MRERERRMRWIAACRLDSLNVTRHTRICSVNSEGGINPTKLNPVPSIFAKSYWKGTPETSRSKTSLIGSNRRTCCFWRSQYSLLWAHVRWCRGSNWFNSLRNRSKLNGKFLSFYWQIQKFFATLIRNIDSTSTCSTQELSFWRS